MESLICIILLTISIYDTSSIGYKTPSLNYTFTLGSNLVNNSNITSPVISPEYYADYPLQMNAWKTKGTYVEYTLPCLMTKFYFCSVYKGVTCGWQFIDLDSQYNNELIFQSYSFTDVQEYQLRFDWISEISYLLSSTGLTVYWNGVALDSFYDGSCTLYTSTYYVKGKVGVNQIAFQGIGLMDSMGLMVRNIQLKQLTYSYPPSNTTNHTSNSTSNSSTTNTSINSNSSSNSSNASSNSSSVINSSSNSNSSNISSNATNISNSSNSSMTNGSNYTNSSNTTGIGYNSTNSTLQVTNNATSNETNSTGNSTNNNATETANETNTTANSTETTPGNSTENSTITTNSTSEQNTTNNSSIVVPNNPYQQSNYSGYSYRSYQSLYQFYNSSQYTSLLRIYNFATKYKSVTFCRSLFSSQQNLRFLVGFMMEFNHLIIYNYHIRNLTLMSNFILVSIQALDEQKAYLTDEYIYPLLGTSPDLILSDFKNRIDLPTNPNNIGTDLLKRPNGVLLEITDIFFVDVHVTLVSFIIGYIIFKLLFNFKISILFRQYSLAGLFFFVLLNGKIQVLTFHFLSEILAFTSNGFEQKMLMVLIVFFYFFIFIFGISLMMLYKSTYQKLVKFIYQNCRQPQYSVPFMTVSFGFYNLALGFAHRLLLNYPNWQIYVLIIIEIVYLISLIFLMIKKFFDNILLGLSLCIMNLLRIAFIITCLIYTYSYNLQDQLSQIQQYLFYSLLISWLASIVLGLQQKFIIIFKIVKQSILRSINKNRIKPSNVNNQKRVRTQKTMGNLKARKIQFKQRQMEEITRQQNNHISITIKSFKTSCKSKKTVFTRVNGFTKKNIAQSTAAIKQKTTVLIKNNHYSMPRNIAT